MPPTPLQIPTSSSRVTMDTPKVHHLPTWGGLGDAQRLRVIRSIAMQRGRDPRIATLALSIIRDAYVQPRDYKGQAAALLKWVQDPKNVYYINEPGERLQDPLYTLKVKYGDCDDLALLLCALFESVKLEWKLVLSGRQRQTGQKKRHIEGHPVALNVNWTHIYCMVGTPPFQPTVWYFCEPTVQNVPLGWDVIDGDHSLLPEMGGSGKSPPPGKRTSPGRFGSFDVGAAPIAVRKDITDPKLNLTDVVKEMLLLEDHLNIPNRRCPDCIRKHLLKIEALAEEACSLDTQGVWRPATQRLLHWLVPARKAYMNKKLDFTALSGQLRTHRKQLAAQLERQGVLGALGLSVSPSVASAVAEEMEDAPASSGLAAEVRKLVPAIVTGVTISVVAQLILDEVRARRAQSR